MSLSKCHSPFRVTLLVRRAATAIGPFQGSFGIEIARRRSRWGRRGWGIVWRYAAGVPSEVEADADQPEDPVPAQDSMRPALLMPLEGGAPEIHPLAQAGQLAFNGALDGWPGHGRQIGIGIMKRDRRSTISLTQDGLPLGDQEPLLLALPRLTVHHNRVKEARGKPGQLPLATDGAGKGGQRLRQVIRSPAKARQGPHAGAGPLSLRATPGAAGGLSAHDHTGRSFTFSLPFLYRNSVLRR